MLYVYMCTHILSPAMGIMCFLNFQVQRMPMMSQDDSTSG